MAKLKNPLSFQVDLSQFEMADEDLKRGTNLLRPNTTFLKDSLQRFSRNPVAMAAFILLIIVFLSAFIVPFFYPYTYDEIVSYRYGDTMDAGFMFLKPFTYADAELKAMADGVNVFPHILGTDREGHDYFIRLLVGTRTSLIIGFFAAAIVLVIGGTIGSLCGFLGGKFDLIVMRIVDIIYSLPDVLIIILLSTGISELMQDAPKEGILSLGSGFISIFIVFALLYWVSMARLVRGQILTIRKSEYVLAAQASGASTARIIRKHLIPNTISVIIISAALQIPSAIFTESFLSYLGLGVQYPHASLGYLAADAKGFLIGGGEKAYMFLVPSIMVCIIVLSLNLLGDGLRDAFDPKLLGGRRS